ncbi:shikimate dehydrogenase, partial [Francisella tularensis subsp. holarctica]|nr:shikimate dehydrogenase [Francisella tularensis subsp. holarctica]
NISDSFDKVINSTSSSIDGKLLPLKDSNFNKNAFAYYLMYADGGTIFTKWSQSYNIAAADVKGILKELSISVFKYCRGL